MEALAEEEVARALKVQLATNESMLLGERLAEQGAVNLHDLLKAMHKQAGTRQASRS